MEIIEYIEILYKFLSLINTVLCDLIFIFKAICVWSVYWERYYWQKVYKPHTFIFYKATIKELKIKTVTASMSYKGWFEGHRQPCQRNRIALMSFLFIYKDVDYTYVTSRFDSVTSWRLLSSYTLIFEVKIVACESGEGMHKFST